MPISAEQWAQLKAFKSGLVIMRGELTDEQAVKAPELYPVMSYSGVLIKAGTRINWEGTLKRAAVDLWDREDQDPAHASNLWEDIVIQGSYREIPEVITAGLAFALGERGWWKGLLYESLIAANTWTPDAYPAGWKRVD